MGGGKASADGDGCGIIHADRRNSICLDGSEGGPVNMRAKPAIPVESTEVAGVLLRNTGHFALGALGAIFLGIVGANRKLTGYRYAG